jgi:hypothetical protein
MHMERKEIIKQLEETHRAFISYIDGLTEKEFLSSYQNKWTAGQQLEHIYLAVRPVTLAVHLPKILVRLIFGKSRREGKTYDELVKKYMTVLGSGGKASRPFIPRPVRWVQKKSIAAKLDIKIRSLCAGVERFSEQELDTMRLPHPLLGRITVREMLYFTIYHVGHHEGLIKRNLNLSAM